VYSIIRCYLVPLHFPRAALLFFVLFNGALKSVVVMLLSLLLHSYAPFGLYVFTLLDLWNVCVIHIRGQSKQRLNDSAVEETSKFVTGWKTSIPIITEHFG
jgi:hypothetical protein